MKKTFAALAVAGFLVLGGSAAANAAGVDYPAAVSCTANPASIEVGGTSTVSCEGFLPGSSVSFSSTGGTIASLVFASAGGTTKTADASGAASASFSSNAAGTFTVTAAGTGADESAVSGSATVTVTAAGTGGETDGELPATGGAVPATAVWLGIGALGLGGIAITAAAARRRAAQQR